MELCTKRLPAHWKTTQCWKAHTAVSTGGVSVKDTNESKGTRGRGRGGERSTPLPPGLSGDGRGLLLNQINRSRDLLKEKVVVMVVGYQSLLRQCCQVLPW